MARHLGRSRSQPLLTQLDLWLDYFALGGQTSLEGMGSYLTGGAPRMPVSEHNRLALALNEAFLDQGGNHPVPYLD